MTVDKRKSLIPLIHMVNIMVIIRYVNTHLHKGWRS